MRNTTMQRWAVSSNPNEREAAWMFFQSISSFETSLDAYINGIIKAETQS